MKEKNIIEVTDFAQEEWSRLIEEAVAFKNNRHSKKGLLEGKRIGLVFDSNSLRTKISFETASFLLGGDSYFIDVHNVTHEKDGTKRESFEDIIDTLDRMVDAYVVRDYSQQLFEIFKKKNNPPMINGFCKVGHPSQALADMAVLRWKKGTIHGLRYSGVCSEAGSGVMESFIYAVLLCGEHITVITPTGKLKGKNEDFHKQIDALTKKYGGSLCVTSDINATVEKADVLYVDEWWEDNKSFLKKKMGKYRVDAAFLKKSKHDLAILHCLPAHPGREIGKEVMRSSQSIIFDEAEFRVYAAMSLLVYLLG